MKHICVSAWFVVLTFTGFGSTAYSQHDVGNGLIVNSSKVPVPVAIRRTGEVGESQQKINPGEKLILRKSADYEFFLLNESVVYPLRVGKDRETDGPWQQRYFHLFSDNLGPVKLATGLSKEHQGKLSGQSQEAQKRLEQRWNQSPTQEPVIRLSDDQLSNAALFELTQKLRTELQLVGHISLTRNPDDHSLAVRVLASTCNDIGNDVRRVVTDAVKQTVAREIAGVVFESACPDQTKQLRQDLQRVVEAAVNLSMLRPSRIVTEQDDIDYVIEASGGFFGDTTTDSVLRELARLCSLELGAANSGRLRDIYQRAKPMVDVEIDRMLSLVPNPPSDDLRKQVDAIQEQIDSIYQLSVLNVDPGNPWVRVDGARVLPRWAIIDGKATIVAHTNVYSSTLFNVHFVSDSIKKLVRRPNGFCLIENRSPATAAVLQSTWSPVVFGLNATDWTGGEYCLYAEFEDGTTETFSPFTPRSNMKYVFKNRKLEAEPISIP